MNLFTTFSRIALLAFILLCHGFTIAQGYQYRYQDSLHLGTMSSDILWRPSSLVYDDSTLISAVTDDSTLHVFSTRPAGNINWQGSFLMPPGGFSGWHHVLRKKPNGNIVIAGTKRGTQFRIGMIELLPSGTQASAHSMATNNSHRLVDFATTADGGLIVMGFHSQPPAQGITVTKIDAQYQVEWARYFVSGYFDRIIPITNGYRLLGKASQVPGTVLALADLDTTGAITRRLRMHESSGISPLPYEMGGYGDYKVCALPNDEQLILADVIQLQGGTGDDGVLVTKLDSAGSPSWTYIYENLGGMKAIAGTPDGGFVLSGYGDGIVAYEGVAGLYKMDSAGFREWETGHGYCYRNDVFDVDLAPDGGFFITGIVHDWDQSAPSEWREMFVFRTDSVGKTGCYDSLRTDFIYYPAIPDWQSYNMDGAPFVPSVTLSVAVGGAGIGGYADCPVVGDTCGFSPLEVEDAVEKTDLALWPNPVQEILKVSFVGEWTEKCKWKLWICRAGKSGSEGKWTPGK